MVRISVSQTYDLSTKLNKMSLIGIHTPNIDIVKKSYGGLLSQAKMIKYHHCDVRLACASVLPADPLQVGVDAGDIAPQDMFNPILYKAVSNQAMNEFELRMQGIRGDADSSSFYGQMLDKTDNVVGVSDEFKVYYSLLANRKGYKVAHPQRGLRMASLRPFVYEMLYSAGDKPSSVPGTYGADIRAIHSKVDTSIEATAKTLTTLRGRPKPMPAVPVSTLRLSNTSPDDNPAYSDDTHLDQIPDYKDMNIYTALIIMPPAKLHVFYYRLVVRWYIDLIGMRPYNDILNFDGQIANADVYYGSDYVSLTKDENNRLDMVDMDGGDITKIMEGA